MARISFFAVLLYCLIAPATISATSLDDSPAEQLAHRVMELSEKEVKARLANFDASLLDHRMDEAVYRRIVNYIEHWPISSGRMIGRSARFYPIFEEELTAAELPLELKHLSIVESALRSWAVSPVGAGGLWQLMPGTARELGLIVSDELDERLDPTLGCAAGLDYLRMQYERYGDWAVALAAYNSGPGNVNRAMRRSGSRDYWKMRRFLPRETRNYVPSFIAAVFVLTYHNDFGLPATQLPLDGQLTERLLVHRRLSLYQVARVTGLQPEVVVELNPQYVRGYLPGLPGGHYLQLPQRVVGAMKEYLARYPAGTREDATELPWAHPLLASGELNGDRYYARQEMGVTEGDTSLRQLADRHGLALDRMLVWSDRGELDSVTVGDTLYHYAVVTPQPYDTRTRDILPPSPQLLVAAPRKVRRPASHFDTLPEPSLQEPVEIERRWWEVFRK